ncbi:MAG: RNA-directed DNA polymerase [Christensenellaceae bacterium]|jgi:hypothetical protein|nr:RNA-directed DNA polymerase [Christensenellaceae bacterium]
MNLNEIFCFENLYEAHKRCRRAKQHKGEVVRFETTLGITLAALEKELVSKKFGFGGYKEFKIYDPKERLIEAPSYKDRVVMMCFCLNSLLSRLEKRLIYDNAACRKNKGTHFGMQRLKQFLKQEFFRGGDNKIYYLKCDISKYFQSINHDILLEKLKKCGFGADEMWFIQKLIKEQPNYTGVGLPLGNQTSQWFALLYLDPIDRLVKEELHIKGYVRYMDDFILIHRDKKYLHYCLKRIKEVCEQSLKLFLNRKTQIGRVQNGIDFLGFRHYLTQTGKVIIKLRGSARVRLKRHLQTLLKLRAKNIVDDDYIEVRKNAFSAHLKHSNESVRLKRAVETEKTKK